MERACNSAIFTLYEQILFYSPLKQMVLSQQLFFSNLNLIELHTSVVL